MINYFKDIEHIKSLKKRQIYGDFILAINTEKDRKNNYLKIPFTEVNLKNIINYNFLWRNTPQGHAFWNDILHHLL